MLEPNLIKMQSMARDMSDEQLTARLQQNQTNPDPYDYLFASELMQRGKQRASAAAPQEPTQTVRDDVVQNAAGLAGLGAPPSLPVEGPSPAASPEPVMMAAEGGLMGLDTSPDMFNERYYANGGIVSFADGGETDPYWAEMERSRPEREYYLTGPASYLWNQAGRNIYDIGALPATFLEGWSYVKDPKTGKLVRKSSQEDFRYFPKSYEGYEQFFGKDQPARREKMTEAELERNPPEPEKRNLRTKYLAGRPSMSEAATAPMDLDEDEARKSGQEAASGLASLVAPPTDYSGFDRLLQEAGNAPAAPQVEVPTVGTEADYMVDISRARKAAGVDVAAREAEQASKMAAEREALGKGKKQDLWAEAALGFLQMAQTPGTVGQGLAAGAEKFLTGAKDVMARVRADEKDLNRREEAQQEIQFARKLGDADAVARAKEKDEDARRAAADRNAELTYGRDAEIYKTKFGVLLEKTKAEMEDARTAQDQAFKFKFLEMEAEKDLKATLASLDFKTRELMMQYTADVLKTGNPDFKDLAEIEEGIRLNFGDQAKEFAEEHRKGFVYNGQTIPPEEVENFYIKQKAQEKINDISALMTARQQASMYAIKSAGGLGRDSRFKIEQR